MQKLKSFLHSIAFFKHREYWLFINISKQFYLFQRLSLNNSTRHSSLVVMAVCPRYLRPLRPTPLKFLRSSFHHVFKLVSLLK